MANLIECKQKMLKDFLNNDSTNDFGTYPQKPCIQIAQNTQLNVLKRSKSSRAATSTIAAIHKASEIVVKTVKYFPFASINFPSTLPRSISSKFSSGSRRKDRDATTTKVKVKDILRWRSSRDLVEEESTPLENLLYSPSRCTINTTTSGSTSCTSEMTSKSSSWCESDFSAEDFPSWCFASEDCFGNNNAMNMSNKKRFSPQTSVCEGISENPMDEADEQYTPVSVLVSPFQENEKSNYNCRFGNNTENISQKNQHNEAEEKAKKLLHHVKKTTLPNSYDSYMEDNLLMDFFWEELPTHYQNDENEEFLESQLIASAQDWLKGVHTSMRENYVKEMEKGLRWNKHEEEEEEIALQLEKIVLNSLVDEVLFGLFTL